MRPWAPLAIVLAVSVASSAPAEDLGAYGATFSVKENDLFSVLRAKLLDAQKSGKIDALNKAFAARVKQRLERPTPVAGLTKASKSRSWLYDPTFVVPRDFSDTRGRVFARQGDRINPLERLPHFNRVLVFIDGDDREQLEFAIRRSKARPKDKVYIVLTKGAPLEIMRKDKVEVFFDQAGVLTTKFGFSHLPAVVEKDGSALRISEVAL